MWQACERNSIGTATNASRTSWTRRRSSICARISGACCASSRSAPSIEVAFMDLIHHEEERTMTKHLRQLLFAAALCTAASATQAQLTEVKVSYQPALYW